MVTINTNVSALAAANSYGRNLREMGASMERLSTGFRINSASDDAAGMAIASKMTSEINGLNQAVRNVNDAISMIQVAEGATIEIVSMIQRMRTLALQSSNDSNTQSDRNSLDNEFQQLIAEIGRISDNTQWNGMNLLDGQTFLKGAEFQVGSNPNQTISLSFGDFAHNSIVSVFNSTLSALNVKGLGENPSWTKIGNSFLADHSSDFIKIGVTSTDGKTIFVTGVDTSSASGRGPVRVYDWDGNTWHQRGNDFFSPEAGNSSIIGADISAGGETIAIGESYMDTAVGENSGRVTVYDWDGQTWVQRGSSIDGVDEGDLMELGRLSEDGNTFVVSTSINDPTGTVRVFEWDGNDWAQKGNSFTGPNMSSQINPRGDTLSIMSADSTAATIYQWDGNSWAQKGLPISPFESDDASGLLRGISADGNNVILSSGGDDTAGENFGATKVFQWNGSDWVQRGNTIFGSSSNANMSSQLSEDGDSLTVSFSAATVAGMPNAGLVRVYEWDGTDWSQKGDDLTGSSPVDLFGLLAVPDSMSSVIGVSALGLAANAGGRAEIYQYPLRASKVITFLDQALDGINQERAKFGATLSRLEYAADNLTNVAQNKAAARGRILDANYAYETSEFARSRIIQQAASAMLSHANQSREVVLSLLK